MSRQSTEKICEFPECGAKAIAKGLCSGHYQQQKKGLPLTERRKSRPDGTPPVIEWDEVPCLNPDLEGPCHVFRGCKTRHGYGQVSQSGKVFKAHRYVWEQKHGPIEEGKVIDHRCRNRACINVDHLRVVTPSINSKENVEGAAWQVNAVKTHCPQGHPYDEENTRWLQGRRYCRECGRIDGRKRYARKQLERENGKPT